MRRDDTAACEASDQVAALARGQFQRSVEEVGCFEKDIRSYSYDIFLRFHRHVLGRVLLFSFAQVMA